jgi:hypothetical protein
MIMKNLIKTILVIILAVFIQSCNLDLAPENVMVDEITYRDSNTAEAALLGAYTRLNASISGAPTGVNNYANTGYFVLFGEIGTPTLSVRENSGFVNMVTSQYNSSDHEGYIQSMWGTTYNAIDYANNVITNINKYGHYSTAAMQRHIAEAKFIRAYEYLLLLQAFGDGALTGDMNGLGVILRLTPYDGYNPEDIQTRITVGDTYTQIITDLEDALNFLPNENAANLTARTRASRTAAFALLSRVYLYKGTYTNNQSELQLAADYADSVINNTKGYTFSTSYTNHTSYMFPLNETGTETNTTSFSTETILLSPCYSSANNYSNGLGSLFYNKSSFYVDLAFAGIYASEDRRGYIDPATAASLLWYGSTTSNPTDLTSFKYNNGNGFNNVIYLRVSEAKLTKAEALARINGINDASITQLNDIRRRPFSTKPAAYTMSSFATPQALIDEILLERMKELAFEGHTRWDLIRTGRPLEDPSVSNDRKILPIPNYDINISYGAIVQNKGYR